MVIVDAKSLYDALCWDQCTGEDERSALEIAIIKESLSIVGGGPSWVPRNFNPFDALTKLEGAHTHRAVEQAFEDLKDEDRGRG